MADDANSKEKWPSYTMVDPRMRKIYFKFYEETYRKTVIDRKTKELIAIAASLASHCKGCLEGHIKKALKDIVISDGGDFVWGRHDGGRRVWRRLGLGLRVGPQRCQYQYE